MNCSTPQYILQSMLLGDRGPGCWRFVLRAIDGSDHLEAEDVEPDIQGERLELLAVVRGLEALDQPSRVTLLTPSKYVREGVRFGLAEWRRNGWRWEFFGQMVPVKNCDLWQRVDLALRFHQVECRTYRVDPPHRTPKKSEVPGGWHVDRPGDPEDRPKDDSTNSIRRTAGPRADFQSRRDFGSLVSHRPARRSSAGPMEACRLPAQGWMAVLADIRCRALVWMRCWTRRLARVRAALATCVWTG